MKHFLNPNLILAVLFTSLLTDLSYISGITNITAEIQKVFQTANYLIAIFIILTLFYYVTEVKRQSISKLAVYIIAITSLYYAVTLHYQIPYFLGEPKTPSDALTHQLIKSSPSFLSLIATVFISIQLIKNECTSPSKKNLKLIGFAKILMIFGSILLPSIIPISFITYTSQILSFMHLLYIGTLIKFYFNERKVGETTT